MKKIYLIILAFTFINNVFASDTTIVRIHNHTDMTTNGNYDELGVLPDDSYEFRKIYLHYTMGCPSSGCAPYDYTTKIEVLHRTGVLDTALNEIIESYELARVITPYGGNIPNTYAFTQTFDITDFVQILRDSVEIRCHYDGWGNGWSATLDFEFIEGTPARDVIKLENIYSGKYNYLTSSDFESTKLVPKKFFISNSSSQAAVKMTTTGHSFDNNINAAEFNPIDYYLKVDGGLTHTQYNWNADCGENPIYPYFETSTNYTHTWILDRANWCPGLKAKTFSHEISQYINPGDSIEINIDFDQFSWSPHTGICPVQGGVCYNGGLGQTPAYIIECQLFQYENANFSNSVEIIDIIKPSLKDVHSRKNPICGKPLIKIRNYGSTQLTSLEIEYNIKGGSINTFNWSGSLDFLETEEVELPNLESWAGSANIFEVNLKNPNGQSDDYGANNSMQSEFETVPEYPKDFRLWLNTNGGINGSFSETSWKFFDQDDNILLESGGLPPNSELIETLEFTPGCYTFMLEDSDEDGLYYGYNNDGSGNIKFRALNSFILETFPAGFGSNLIHQFTVEGSTNTPQNISDEIWKIFPNPTKDNFIIEGFSETKTKIILTDNLAKEAINITTKSIGFISEKIDLTTLENGIYILEISNKNTKTIKKVVKQ